MLLAIVAVVAGCVTQPVANYEELAGAIRSGEDVDARLLRAAFLADPDYAERLEHISSLEAQAVHLVGEEPLRLGPLGSAIVERYPGSLAGHHALATFYAYLEREETAAKHRKWVSRILASMDRSGTGTLESPLPVISPAEPNAYLMATGRTPVGSMYLPLDGTPFLLEVAAKPVQGRIENVYFDLGPVYSGSLQDAHEEEDDYHPIGVIVSLARRDQANDAAAQTFLGSLNLDQGRIDDAAAWLTQASRSGNLIAQTLLARTYWSKAMNAPEGPEREWARRAAVDHYEQSIDMGSDEAMYDLGRLYALGAYGPDFLEPGLELVGQAADLGNSVACLFLARRFEFPPPPLESDYDKSEEYYLRGASLENSAAKIDYARFLMREDTGRKFNAQAYRWLRGLANNGRDCGESRVFCAEARVQLGNLFAKGIHVRRNYRKARSWFKSAVAASPEHARVVNDVAWTLTVSNLERLRDEGYALEIMDHVMTQNERARGTPAYIDTWAAAYAANGDFERAIELQREAVELYGKELKAADAEQADDETITILRQHLQAFEAGRTITELIP